MAAKRSSAKSKAKVRAPSRPTRKAPAKVADSVAVKLLGQLPAIDATLRKAYLASFSEAQCSALGEKTQAAKVLAEAVAWLPTLQRSVKVHPVGGYSARRLAFLAELVVALEDERSASGGGGARTSTLTWGRVVKADLAARLAFLAGGREDLVAQVQGRAGHEDSLHQVRDALTGLIDLATRWRRDPLFEVLADDADLTTARLSAAYNALEALARTDEVLREVVADGGDSAGVNAIEGRILAELNLAHRAFREARAAGASVPALVAGPSLRLAFASPAAQ
jgi:hypothetical protein